jgi:N-acetylglucosamine-6-phosphate deacetylase
MDAREPIWIDLQVNGFAGIDFSFPDITVSQVKDITRRLASEGTAGY